MMTDDYRHACALYDNFWGVKDFDNSLAATLNMFPSFFLEGSILQATSVDFGIKSTQHTSISEN